MNRIAEITARLAEIRAELAKPEADIDALEKEADGLITEREGIEAAAQRRSTLESRILAMPAPTARTFPQPTQVDARERTPGKDSPEAKSAWLKMMARHPGNGHMLLGDLNEMEKLAYTFTTTEAANFIPAGIQLGIVDSIKQKSALFADLAMTNFAGAVEFQQITAVSAGDAAATSENTAATNNLALTNAKVSMSGTEYRDSAKMSNKTRLQSIDQFETWLIDTLGDRLARIINVALFTMLDSDIQDANVLTTSTTLDAQEVRQLHGMLAGGSGPRVCYANNFTIWNEIAAVVDSYGKEKFIESPQTDDPVLQGRIYGTLIKLDETLANSVMYIGYPRTIKANMFEAPNVLSDLNVETREMLWAGYALFEARMGDVRSFTKCTIAQVS
jgi:HK97 family phage major capsid protein